MAYSGIINVGGAEIKFDPNSLKILTNEKAPPKALMDKIQGKKKKKFKSPEHEAISIMADARKKRIDEVKEKLEVKDNDYKQHLKTIAVLRKTKKSLLEEYLALANEKKGTLVNEYRKVITQLKISELITAVDVDSEKRLIFTTRPVVVKKTTWKHARLAGIYQIRVDFTKRDYGSAIQILNITQRQGGHDHPHVSDTVACWGNVSGDIDKDYKDKNIYELLVDIIDYLQSGADNDGYLQYDGDEDALSKEFSPEEKDGSENSMHAWEQFLAKAEKMPPGYCFEMYEQKKLEKKIPKIEIEGYGGSGGVISQMVTSVAAGTATAGAMSITADYDNWWYNMNSQMMQTSPYANREPISYYRAQMAELLQELGLTEKASYHFISYIKPGQERFIARLELRFRGDVFWLLVHAVRPEPIRITTEAQLLDVDTLMPIISTEIQRIFINKDDVKEELWEQFEREESRLVRVGFQVSEAYLEEQRQREEIERREAEEKRQMVQDIIRVADGFTKEVPLGDSDHESTGQTDEVMVDEPPTGYRVELIGKKDREMTELHNRALSPEKEMHQYGIVAASDPRPVKKKKTTKFMTADSVTKTLEKLI